MSKEINFRSLWKKVKDAFEPVDDANSYYPKMPPGGGLPRTFLPIEQAKREQAKRAQEQKTAEEVNQTANRGKLTLIWSSSIPGLPDLAKEIFNHRRIFQKRPKN